MKNKFITFYSIFAAIVIVFSIAFFAVNLYQEYSYGQTRTENRFSQVQSDLKKLSSAKSNQDYFKQIIKDSVGSLTDFSYIKIKYNDKNIYTFPNDFDFQSQNKSSLIVEKKALVPLGMDSATLECGLYLLRPYSIFYYAKISFLIILILTIVTISIIIYFNKKNKRNDSLSDENDENDENDEKSDIGQSPEDTPTESESVISDDSTTQNTEKEKAEESSVESSTQNEPSPDAAQSNVSASTKDEEPSPETSSAPATEEPEETPPVTSELSTEEEKPAEIDEKPSPAGLFSPVTGFGWESYLMTRLDNEINRAVASEIDLSLFILRVTGIERASETIKNVCNYLNLQFQFKDLLFEYKEDSFAAIKVSMNLDEALSLADKLQADITNMVEEKGGKCYIGISTRSIRIVSGERLLEEAEQALVHAQEDPDSPVIAFRVDSEKYRKFLEEQNQ